MSRGIGTLRGGPTAALVLGPGAMLLSAMLFAVLGALVKIAIRGGVPATEVTFVRFAFGLLTCVALGRLGVIELKFGRPGLLAVRGVFGSISAMLFFISVTYTSLARSTLLCYTYVIFSAWFGAWLLRERLGSGGIVALVVAIIGVVMLTLDDFSAMRTFATINRGDLLALLSGFLGGIAITSIRELRKTESAYAIFTAFCACGVVTSGVMARNGDWVIPGGSVLGALAGVGLIATGGQLLMTASYRYCSVALGGLLSLVTVVLAAIVGWVAFHEVPTAATLGGSVLVLGAASYLTLLEAGSGRTGRSS